MQDGCQDKQAYLMLTKQKCPQCSELWLDKPTQHRCIYTATLKVLLCSLEFNPVMAGNKQINSKCQEN